MNYILYGPEFQAPEYQQYAYDPAKFALPNADERTRQLGDYMQQVSGREALTLDQAMANQARAQQMAQLGQSQAGMADASQMVRAQAMGQAPSAAQMQMQQGLEAAIAGQRSQVASARGLNPALAQKYAAQGIAQAQQGAIASAGQLRAQEQAQAQQLFAGMQSDYANAIGNQLAGMRQQDLGAAGTNLQSALSQRASADQAGQFGLGSLLGMDQAQMQGGMTLQQALAEENRRRQETGFQTAAIQHEAAMTPWRAGWSAAGDLVGAGAKAALL